MNLTSLNSFKYIPINLNVIWFKIHYNNNNIGYLIGWVIDPCDGVTNDPSWKPMILPVALQFIDTIGGWFIQRKATGFYINNSTFRH